MAKKVYQSVDFAMQKNDHKLLSDLGRLGGKRSGERRRTEAEKRRALQALEDGTIVSAKKVRLIKKAEKPVVEAVEPTVDPQFDALMEEIYRAQVLKDATAHHMRNLAGVSQK